MEQQIKTIKIVLEALLEKMTIVGQIDFIDEEYCPRFVIKTRESGLLIGEEGKNLTALNHLVKKIVENELRKSGAGEKLFFLLDVNDYYGKKIEQLKNVGRMSAQRVRYFKKEIEMDPMGSYDRRIIHSILSEYPDIKTESVGEEPNRRVIIKPL